MTEPPRVISDDILHDLLEEYGASSRDELLDVLDEYASHPKLAADPKDAALREGLRLDQQLTAYDDLARRPTRADRTVPCERQEAPDGLPDRSGRGQVPLPAQARPGVR